MNVNIVIVTLLIIFTLIAFGVVIDHGPRLFTTKELHEIANAAIGGFVLVFFICLGAPVTNMLKRSGIESIENAFENITLELSRRWLLFFSALIFSVI